MIKVKIEKLKKYGENGVSLQLPTVYQSDHKLIPGDEIELYRSQIDGRDAIIVIGQKVKNQKR